MGGECEPQPIIDRREAFSFYTAALSATKIAPLEYIRPPIIHVDDPMLYIHDLTELTGVSVTSSRLARLGLEYVYQAPAVSGQILRINNTYKMLEEIDQLCLPDGSDDMTPQELQQHLYGLITEQGTELHRMTRHAAEALTKLHMDSVNAGQILHESTLVKLFQEIDSKSTGLIIYDSLD